MRKPTVFLLCALAVLPLASNGNSEQTSAPVSVEAKIIYLEGDVTVGDIPGEEGMIIPRDTPIRTGRDSYCEVMFAQKNIIKIQEDTLTEIYVTAVSGRVDVQKGSLAFVLEKLDFLRDGEDFLVTTPLTTAGIRGTAFFLKVEKPNMVYFCNCNGRIEISDREGKNNKTLKASKHKAVRYNLTSSGKMVVSDAPLLYHDDDEMDELAEKISHNIPWGDSYDSSY